MSVLISLIRILCAHVNTMEISLLLLLFGISLEDTFVLVIIFIFFHVVFYYFQYGYIVLKKKKHRNTRIFLIQEFETEGLMVQPRESLMFGELKMHKTQVMTFNFNSITNSTWQWVVGKFELNLRILKFCFVLCYFSHMVVYPYAPIFKEVTTCGHFLIRKSRAAQSTSLLLPLPSCCRESYFLQFVSLLQFASNRVARLSQIRVLINLCGHVRLQMLAESDKDWIPLQKAANKCFQDFLLPF